jgi:3-oxoacyl-[acyl-carrier-protein] synthase-1
VAPDHSGVVVTGIGARAALGDHALQIAASVRAGLSGFRDWHAGGPEPIPAAFTDPPLGDYPWTEKVRDLLRSPVEEALFTAGLHDTAALVEEGRSGRLRAYLGAPHRGRPGAAPDALARLVPTLAEDLIRGGVTAPLDAFGLDQPSGALALANACESLQGGRAEIALVCGVDSLLHNPTLRPLLSAGRLKSSATPSGLIPGEAGACFIVETAAHARRRKAEVLARVEAIALEQEDVPTGPEAPVTVTALGRALERAQTAGGAARSFTRVLSDLNGERWRFLEWALAETRFPRLLAPGTRHWHPADVLGDVGAAFIPLAVVLAARAFARGYAGTGPVLILASSERGERSAIALAPPERR